MFIIQEIERLLFSDKANENCLYNSVVYLSQTIIKKDEDEEIVVKLIEVYFDLFNKALKVDVDGKLIGRFFLSFFVCF